MKLAIVPNEFKVKMNVDLKCEYCGHIVRDYEIDLDKQSYNIPDLKCDSCKKSSMDVIRDEHEYVV